MSLSNGSETEFSPEDSGMKVEKTTRNPGDEARIKRQEI